MPLSPSLTRCGWTLLFLFATAILTGQGIEGATIHAFSGESCAGPATKLIDGDPSDVSSWRAIGDPLYPQDVIIALNDLYFLRSIALTTYAGRAYEYELALSTDADLGFVTVASSEEGSTTGEAGVFQNEFDTQPARYVRLRITGGGDYSGQWVSINEISFRTANTTSLPAAPPQKAISAVWPNPADSAISIRVDHPQATVVLYDSAGAELLRQAVTGGQGQLATANLPAGLYFVRVGPDVHRLYIR